MITLQVPAADIALLIRVDAKREAILAEYRALTGNNPMLTARKLTELRQAQEEVEAAFAVVAHRVDPLSPEQTMLIRLGMAKITHPDCMDPPCPPIEST